MKEEIGKRKPRLLVDKREQCPLTFSLDKFDVVNQSSSFGDYHCEIPTTEGTYTQVPVCFERKGLGDLFGTMGKGYPRFRKELERARESKYHLTLIIEGSIKEVHKGYHHSSISGDTMLKKLAMLRVRYDLEVLFFEDRRSMARWVEEVFDAVHRNYTAGTPSTA